MCVRVCGVQVVLAEGSVDEALIIIVAGEAGEVDREAWRIRALLVAAPAGCSHARPR